MSEEPDDEPIESAATHLSRPGSDRPAASPAAAATAVTLTAAAATFPREVALTTARGGLLDQGADRYREGDLLGVGGMGEVRLQHDARIGREVALKRLRTDRELSADAIARFIREAQVQGQLEHPAIVPIYDLGLTPDGAPYFTMRRLRGLTLEEILRRLADGDPAIASEYSRQRLLTSFIQVCQAIDYAHRRGVLHRDLKPSNIMLGAYGEVYVLDWGVARLVSDPASSAGGAAPGAVGGDTIDATAAGTIVGTLGYMAPEQLLGQLDRLDVRLDVYALGAILFELLTGEPLHPRAGTTAIYTSTLEGIDARPSARAPEHEIGPELEAICVRATALEPDARYPSVHAMVEELQRYLDGDRDLARRAVLAAEYAAAAVTAAARALGAAGGTAADRTLALREAGRALALDPDNERALDVISRLMLEPPRELPAEVDATLEGDLQRRSRAAARRAMYLMSTYALNGPPLIWMGVKNWPLAITLVALNVAMVASAYLKSRSAVVRSWQVYLSVLLHAVFLGVATRLFGPFVLIPNLVAVAAIAGMLYERLQRVWITLALYLSAVVVPALLEAAALIAPIYQSDGEHICLTSSLVNTPPTATFLFVLVAGSLAIVLPCGFIWSVLRARALAERQLQMQAWQLRQLMPEAAKTGPAPAPRASA